MHLSQIEMIHTRAILVAVKRDGFRVFDMNSAVKCAQSRGAVRISLTIFESLSCRGSGLGDSRKEGECCWDGNNLHVSECNKASKMVGRSDLLDTFDILSKRFEADTELKMGIKGGAI